jgi:hypothetical protein
MFENDDLDQMDNLDTPQETGQSGSDPQPFEIPEDALVSVKVDGQDKLLPWREARSGVMFQSAFTRKTQELAQQRREFEENQRAFQSRQTEYDAQLGRLQGVLSNPTALAALYMHLQSQQQQPRTPQPLTEEYLPKIEQGFEQKLQAALGQMRNQFQQERQAEKFEAELDTFMGQTLQRHPILRAVDGIEDTIYGRVAALKPKSLDEAKELARTMIEGMSSSALKAYEEQQKQAALAKAKAGSGIEPRGGAPVFNRPPEVKRLEDLDNAFIQYLQQQGRAQD